MYAALPLSASALTSGTNSASVETSSPSASVQLTNSYPSFAVAVDPLIVLSSALRSIVSSVSDTEPPSAAVYVSLSSFFSASGSAGSSGSTSVALKFAVYVTSPASLSALTAGTYVESCETSLPSLSVQLTNSYPSLLEAVAPFTVIVSALRSIVSSWEPLA